MSKPLLFYAIGEYISVSDYCKRKGLKSYKTIEKTLDGEPFPVVIQYTKNGYIYDVLEYNQCYSGYAVVLMRCPKLSYEELLNVALESKNMDERVGAIGLILKDHPVLFEKFLLSVNMEGINKKKKKQIKRLVSFIYDFARVNSNNVRKMENINALCEKLKEQLKHTGKTVWLS